MSTPKYQLNFWINGEKKEESEKIRKEKRLSHADLYYKGIEQARKEAKT